MFLLLVPVLCLQGAVSAQQLAGRLIYSRETPPNGEIRLNDGMGNDSLLIPSGQYAKIDDSGRYIFYLQGTTLDNPFYGGNWMRYSAYTSTSTVLFNSTDYLTGSDMVPEDSSNVVGYYCAIYHNDFNNDPISTVTSADCFDDAPDVRSTEPRVVFHNINNSLFTVHLDGTLRTPVPNTTHYDTWPSWSPDGQWILFGRCNFAMTGASTFDVVNFFKVKANGDSLTMITQNDTLGPALFSSNAVWNGDGTEIITAGLSNGRYGLMAIAADGSGVKDTIPTTPGDTIRFVSGTLDLHVATAGIATPADASVIQLWPVPVKDILNVALNRNGHWHSDLVDEQGRLVWTGSGADQRFTVPMRSLPSGLYHLRTTADDGTWSVGRTMIKQ